MTEDFETRARRAAEAVRRGVDQHDAPEGGRQVVQAAVRATTRERTIRRTIMAISTAVFVMAASSLGVSELASQKGDDGPQTPGIASEMKSPFVLAGDLKPFNECKELLTYFKSNGERYFEDASRQYGGRPPEPLNGIDSPSPETRSDMAAEDSGRTAAPTTTIASGTTEKATATAGGSPAFSTTNVQEKGVDEPDVLKTDGKHVFSVAAGKVQLLDIQNGVPILRKTLDETRPSSLLLHNDHLLVFSSGEPRDNRMPSAGGAIRIFAEPAGVSETTLTIYNVEDIANPQRLQRVVIDGSLVDARMVGSIVRFAVSYSPDLEIPSPTYDSQGNLTIASREAMRNAIANTAITNWVPSYKAFFANDTKPAGEGQLVACDRLARPTVFSGLSTLGVMSFDVQDNSVAFTHADERVASVGVVANAGERVYANEQSFYVTSADWETRGQATSTDIHKFGVDKHDRARLSLVYKGSGRVAGTLLNSYAMSEHENVLRIATTINGSTGWLRRTWRTEGVVTTLGEKDGSLQELGRLDGLGRDDNESIRAVRYIGALGYVVTFRQTDPLYVIDLRDPAAPKKAGELKIPGFSGYLHPVGKDRLIGVGQGSGDDVQRIPASQTTVAQTPMPPNQGMPTPEAKSIPAIAPMPMANALQFRLFDVSNPADPKVIDTRTYGSGAAHAQFDPKAFLYWEPRNLAITPVLYQESNTSARPFNGLVLLSPEEKTLREGGRIGYHNADTIGSVMRTAVIGDNVFSLSDNGLQSNSLETHKIVGTIEFKRE